MDEYDTLRLAFNSLYLSSFEFVTQNWLMTVSFGQYL